MPVLEVISQNLIDNVHFGTCFLDMSVKITINIFICSLLGYTCRRDEIKGGNHLISTDAQMTSCALAETVSSDLKYLLKQYRNPKVGLRLLAGKIGIHEKTLKRLIDCCNKPTYLTLYKIYRIYFNTQNDRVVYERAPEVVQVELKKGNPKKVDTLINYSTRVEDQLVNDSVFREIYILCATGPVREEFIQFRFGQFGTECLRQMLTQKVLDRTEGGTFVLGENQANFTPNLIKLMGAHFVDKYSKPENSDVKGNNLIAYYAEGVSHETYQEWLKIDEDAFYKKIELTKNNGAKGDVRAFTFMATDTLEPRGLS